MTDLSLLETITAADQASIQALGIDSVEGLWQAIHARGVAGMARTFGLAEPGLAAALREGDPTQDDDGAVPTGLDERVLTTIQERVVRAWSARLNQTAPRALRE